jgi:hypothetical protein
MTKMTDLEQAPSAGFMIAKPIFDPDDEITQPYERLVVDERTDAWFRPAPTRALIKEA